MLRQRISLRRIRRLILRFGDLWSTLLVTLVTTIFSLFVTFTANAMLSLPPELVRYTFVLAALIPMIVSPPLAWLVLRLMFEAEEARNAAERLAVTDPLTHVFNRRHFFDAGEHVFARSHGGQQALSVLLLDIDYFKRVNDQHGHAVGDMVLQAVAQICTDHVGERELLARLGGEEFAILLPETEQEGAVEVAERLRHSVEALCVPAAGSAHIKPTVSIGVASVTSVIRSLDGLLANADLAMYAAKSGGRNRVTAYSLERVGDLDFQQGSQH